ncbi:MAG TPA: Hsp20/alpha crystallin family protein [Tepidisphaeraceae bacterium]|nr:Hsp20/alpha crystallin family protein [Tepidisphaeraceae bacterium]
MDPFTRDFDAAVQRLFGRDGGVSAGFAVDIWETPDALHVEAELPGFDRDQIDVMLENSVLTITGERKQSNEQSGREWLLNERRAVRFSRSFNLPPTVDDSQVEAKFDNGVLHITIAKREEVKPRKISIG